MRIVSALVLLPVVLLCVWEGGYPFLILTSVGGVIVVAEWLAVCGVSTPGLIASMSATLLGAMWLASGGSAGYGLILLATVTFLFGRAARGVGVSPGSHDSLGLPHRVAQGVANSPDIKASGSGDRYSIDPPGPDAEDLAWRVEANRTWLGIAGLPYFGVAGIGIVWLRADPVAGFANTLFLLAIVWGSDIGAYATGRLLGGSKLAPRISPGKTWSGAVGGLGGAAVAATLVAACLSKGFSPAYVIGLAVGLGVVSQIGDLLESGLKRFFGVKDSGRIIPGHGGLLDRLDSLLAAAPVAALLAYDVGRGEVLWR